MKAASWNTGSLLNHLFCQKMSRAYGRTRARQICMNSKKYSPFVYHLFALTCPKSKSTPTCITLSPDSSSFVTFSLPDRQVRVFSFLAGKLTRKYDESLQAIQEMQQAGTAMSKLDDMEFGRRLAMERELEMPGPDGHVPGRWSNAIWDESGAFILYPSLLGVKGVCASLGYVPGTQSLQSSTQ
jgi:hypothetical protein